MTIIEASSVNVKTLADGTLRVSMDVEPRHAQAAFSLFGAPGTPMALAALKINGGAPESSDRPDDESGDSPKSEAKVSAKQGSPAARQRTNNPAGVRGGMDELAPPPKRTTGPICQWLALRCKEIDFQQWVGQQSGLGDAIGEARVAEWCREQCGVESRRDIDGSVLAEGFFDRFIRKPWLAHMRGYSMDV